MAIDIQIILNKLSDRFGEAITSGTEKTDYPTIYCLADKNIEVLDFLYYEPVLQFQYLTDITAVHYPEQPNSFCVVYHLHSLVTNTRLRIKCWLSGENPTIKSATGLYAGANWMERETYDFFGIKFEGHPNLKRILNVDHMEVFPMRKEYPLEDPNRVDKKDYFFGR